MSLAHHTLGAWQRADDLFIRLHQLSLKAFRAYERFELGGQAGLIRSARLNLMTGASVGVVLIAYLVMRLA